MEINAALTYAALNLKKLIKYLDITEKWDKIVSKIPALRENVHKINKKIDLENWRLVFQMS